MSGILDLAQRIILIDNRDSFTFNLVDSLRRLGAQVEVYRNCISAHQLLHEEAERRSLIVLSPGPGRPTDAGCCLEVIALAKGKVPVLGICLGLQALGEAAGIAIQAALQPVHGEASYLEHDGEGLLSGLPSSIRVGRYHSLCVPELPERFRVHATLDGMVMAALDEEAGQMGLQFHPESILTPYGDAILTNSLRLSRRFYDA